MSANTWRAIIVLAPIFAASIQIAFAQTTIDIVVWFGATARADGIGMARKTRLVDVRPARGGEVVVSVIAGEGKETQSPPAREGDVVVRNRCAATGNEEILVAAATFARRYEGPVGAAVDGWSPYRPRGVPMRYVIVPAAAEPFAFIAPWGEPMVARPGDAIVQDADNPKDTYRIARAAFDCTYEITEPQQVPQTK